MASAPFEWKSGTWTSLHLQIRKVSEGKWIIEGRAWVDGTPEPKDWPISFEVSETLPAGKASIWGAPYSGKPISVRRSKRHLAATLIQERAASVDPRPPGRKGNIKRSAACARPQHRERPCLTFLRRHGLIAAAPTGNRLRFHANLGSAPQRQAIPISIQNAFASARRSLPKLPSEKSATR